MLSILLSDFWVNLRFGTDHMVVSPNPFAKLREGQQAVVQRKNEEKQTCMAQLLLFGKFSCKTSEFKIAFQGLTWNNRSSCCLARLALHIRVQVRVPAALPLIQLLAVAPKKDGPNPRGMSYWSSRLLVSAWSSPSHWGHVGVNQEMEDPSFSLSLCVYNSDFQNKSIFKVPPTLAHDCRSQQVASVVI